MSDSQEELLTSEELRKNEVKYCPYCGHEGAFDGQGYFGHDTNWYGLRCTDCGKLFMKEVLDDAD